MLLLMFLMVQRTTVEALQVIGGNMTMVQGETVVLPCKITETTESLIQISWLRKTRGKPQLENFFTILPKDGPKYINGDDKRFNFIGSTNDKNGSLQLSDVTLTDEGIYKCIFTLFPSGHYETEIPLNVLVSPVTSVKDNRPFIGTEEVPLATCTAAVSKPPAEVKWITGSLAKKVNVTTDFTTHDNGTTTTVSSLLGIPTREINNHLVQCVITNTDLSKEETLDFTMQIDYPPMEVNFRELKENSFECVSDANPTADFTWSRTDNSELKSDVKIEAGKIQFLSMTSYVNGGYQCEASNTYGKKHGVLYVHVVYGNCIALWIFFILSLLLNIAAGAYYGYKCWQSTRSEDTQSSPDEGAAEAEHLTRERQLINMCWSKMEHSRTAGVSQAHC